jgi:hypothetical protein
MCSNSEFSQYVSIFPEESNASRSNWHYRPKDFRFRFSDCRNHFGLLLPVQHRKIKISPVLVQLLAGLQSFTLFCWRSSHLLNTSLLVHCRNLHRLTTAQSISHSYDQCHNWSILQILQMWNSRRRPGDDLSRSAESLIFDIYPVANGQISRVFHWNRTRTLFCEESESSRWFGFILSILRRIFAWPFIISSSHNTSLSVWHSREFWD